MSMRISVILPVRASGEKCHDSDGGFRIELAHGAEGFPVDGADEVAGDDVSLVGDKDLLP